ncbi:MAG: M13 family metallopeptidase [Chitinophagaceae bacterium]|nr:M13 family metallopeptidase [Bacteroidota bacterium]MCC6258277.1 M13 family metallopeptidase [Chitinophagaceae bacterium]MCW5916590.1 M13 family metallopeptidase [Ferruginibacter sp.]
MRLTVLAFAALGILGGCSQKNEDKKEIKPDVVEVNVDSTVKPGNDFFLFANGKWIKENPIPAEQSSWGIGNLVIEENLKRLREISEKAAANNAAKGSNDQKIGDFWHCAMDSASIESNGIRPLTALLQKIDAIKDINGLVETSAELKTFGSSTLFSDWVAQDPKKSDLMAYTLWQGGLGLPEREYYFKPDSSTTAIRNAYVIHITRVLTLAGVDTAKSKIAADNILKMETGLARSSRKLEDLRDPYSNYNKMAITDLGKMAPAINWAAYLPAIGVKSVDSVIVGQPEFFKSLNQTLNQTSLETWKLYLKYNLLNDLSAALPDAFVNEAFNFQKLFSGAKAQKPRWKRAISMEENAMGELLGQLYVKEFFNETAKKRYTDLVESIRTALKDRITNLTWMTDSTKQKAYAKLAAITAKVGYPNKWKDFSALEIGKESFVQNVMNANKFWHNYEYNKLGKPVDREEWDMYPQTYNAYYNPSNNEIVLPAGIFTVPGYRDEELDDAVVFGYAGASTIGHEITHGFDDEGRQYDAQGNLKNWWTKADEDAFKKRADVMVKQFDAYEPVPGYHINGKATLGENIADLGGILLGIEAFKKTDQFKKNEKIAGFTPMQRFFLGYSLGWLGNIRVELLKNRLLTDVHSPAKYRVNGPFADVDEFYSNFGVLPTDSMYIPDSLRVHIW